MACGLFEFVVVLITIVSAFYFMQKRRSRYFARRNIPFFPPSLIDGNITNPFTSKIAMSELVGEIYKKARKQGLHYFGLFTFMLRPSFVIVDLKLLKNIMVKDFQYFTDRGFYYNEKDDPLSAHLFAIGGPLWRSLRVKMTPTFTAGKMKQMFQTVANCGIVLKNIMTDRTQNDEPVDIKDILGCYSTDIICSCAFGLESNTSNDPDSLFRQYGKKFFESASKWRLIPIIFSSNFPDLARKLHIRFTQKDISEFFINVVKDTIKFRKDKNVTRNDFLQLMIEMQQNDPTVTLNVVAAQCFVFFIAGFETSSTTMTFALYEISKNQEIQEKIRAEIEEVLNKHNGEITYESIMDLKYMGQVVDETLRKYPPLPFITRECVKDYKLPNEDTVIRKGERLTIPVRGIHLDEEYYPDPLTFDPERFNEENKKKIPDMAYMPFGEGPRLCIGMRFGIMQTKVGLTSILRNFKCSINPKTQEPLEMSRKSFVLSSEGGIWLDIEKI